MTDKKLQMNEDKTETLLFNSSKFQDPFTSSVHPPDYYHPLWFSQKPRFPLRQRAIVEKAYLILFARQLSLNFSVSALFDIIFQLTPLKPYTYTFSDWLLLLSLFWPPTVLDLRISKSTKLCSTPHSSCILMCTRHTNSKTAPLITRQNSHLLPNYPLWLTGLKAPTH